MKSKLSLLCVLFFLFKTATGKRTNTYAVICHLSVIQTCVLASITRCRQSFDCFLSCMSSSVNVSLQPMPFGDAPSENTENLPRKIQSSGQYFQQGLTLLEALCSSSWSRSSNAAMSAFKKEILVRTRLIGDATFFGEIVSLVTLLHKHDVNSNSNSNKKLQSLPFPWYFQKITNDRFLTFFC